MKQYLVKKFNDKYPKYESMTDKAQNLSVEKCSEECQTQEYVTILTPFLF